MWANYFLSIRKKYTMRVSTKTPLIINLDGKNTTKNKEINILETYKGGFRSTLETSAKYFSNKYECLCILGGDEISFIFENPMVLINDLNNEQDNFTSEIISVFSQYFFDYFNNFYDKDKIFWHGKCFSIHNAKIHSFIKYKSKLIHVLSTTYFLKKNGIRNAGNIKLEEKIKMCEQYNDYKKIKEIEKGTLYFKGNKIDLEEFLKGNINTIYETNNVNVEFKNNIDDVDIEFDI